MHIARPSVSIKPFFLRTLLRLTGWSYPAFVIGLGVAVAGDAASDDLGFF